MNSQVPRPPFSNSTSSSNVRPRSEASPPPYEASGNTKIDLDITSRVERKLAQYNASQNIFKRWLFEILSVATSAICMGAIIAILACLKDRPLDKWPQGLTFITILSKVASAALILPISEAIGQLKWSWFYEKESKDAFDFEIFDKASRGAWGSVLLLFRTRGKSLAALGALLTVLLLAIDTFFQQLTDSRERWTLRGQGLVPRAIWYEPNAMFTISTDVDIPMARTNQDLKSALAPYFYDQNGTQYTTSNNGSQANFPLSCPTSQCEWEPYQTLGVCGACADVSQLLTYACLPMKMDWIRTSSGPGTESTWPNGTACGYFLNATSSAPVLMSGYRVTNSSDNSTHGETLLMRALPLVTNWAREPLYGGSINFGHIAHHVLDALIVSSSDGTAESVYRQEVPVAHECMLSWCVKTLRSSYHWGTYWEQTESIFYNTSQMPYPWSTVDIPGTEITETDYHGNLSFYPSPRTQDDTEYGLSNDTVLDFVLPLDEIFPSSITVAGPSAEPYFKIKMNPTKYTKSQLVRFSPWLAPNNITHHMEGMAAALTNVMRADANSREFVSGPASAPETYVHVSWAWLAFPLAMLVLCLTFLVATIVKTSRDTTDAFGTWKTSAMPTLMYSLPKETRHNLTTNATWRSEESGGAKRVKIRLMPHQGWRVSGYACTSPTSITRDHPQPPPGWV